MKKRTKQVLTLVLLAVFLVSGGMLIKQAMDYRQGDEIYGQAQALVGMDDPVQDPAFSTAGLPEGLLHLDLPAMREVSPDALGWITIPDSVISYPLVQGEDNQYYLNHTWDGQRSSVGAIFLEETSSPDLSDFHTLIYGHRMGNGSMFNSLHDFQDQGYYDSHPYVYLAAEDGLRRYAVFAAYEASVDSLTYQIGFPDDESRETFLTHCLDSNVITTGLTPTAEDQILTLSTCTGRGHATRWVVQAILDGFIPA